MARFVLINPSHNGNVGAAARALKTMGFDDLWLVAPKDTKVLNRSETIQRASGAHDVLKKTRIVATLDEAFEGVNHVCATAMTARDFGPPTYAPRAYFEVLLKTDCNAQYIPQQEAHFISQPLPLSSLRMAFVFGTERFGMRNEDVYKCHAALSIPTNPQYGSLNLASAVQLLAYDWRQALGGYGASLPSNCALADAAAVSGVLSHWEQALVHLGFLNPQAPKKLMPRLHGLLNRAQLQEEEIHILRGIAKAVLQSQSKRQATALQHLPD
jgi:tRNA/rRNA methyltransferase